MLMAHSTVLRCELQDSEIAEKGVVTVPDVYPDTFKNLLRFVYGYDNTDRLSFDDADNLLYVAEKYMINRLKDRLATRLMSLLSYNNICTLMNNPACYRHLELNSAITEILQNDIEKVLDIPLFLDLTSEAFLKVLEQDSMNVLEIDLWRAAVKWATYRAGSENSELLREQLTPHLQLIRLCTLSGNELCQEVAPTDILTDSELVLVIKSIGLQQQQEQLTGICNTIIHRSQVRPEPIEVTFPLTSFCNGQSATTMTICTKQYLIELVSFTLKSYNDQISSRNLPFKCTCKVKIDCQSQNSDPPVTVRFSEDVYHNAPFHIPIIDDNGKNMCLLPDNTYTVTVTCDDGYKIGLYYERINIKYSNAHFTVDFEKYSNYFYGSHIQTIAYKLLPQK